MCVRFELKERVPACLLGCLHPVVDASKRPYCHGRDSSLFRNSASPRLPRSRLPRNPPTPPRLSGCALSPSPLLGSLLLTRRYLTPKLRYRGVCDGGCGFYLSSRRRLLTFSSLPFTGSDPLSQPTLETLRARLFHTCVSLSSDIFIRFPGLSTAPLSTWSP